MPRRFRTTYLTRGLLTWLLVVGLIGSCAYVTDPLHFR
jgi:hypothetical protein